MATLRVNIAQVVIVLFSLFSLSLNSFLQPLFASHLNLLLITGLASLVLAVVSVYWACPLERRPLGKVPFRSLNYFLVFALFAVISSLVLPPSLNLTRWVEVLSFLAVPFLFALLLPSAFQHKDYEAVLKILLVVISFASLLALVLYATASRSFLGLPLAFAGFTEENFIRHCIYQNRNYAAMAIAWAPAFSASLWLKEKRAASRMLYAFCFLATTTHLFFTFSRGGQLMGLIACLPLFGPVYQKNRNALFTVLTLLAVALIVTAFVHPFVQYKLGKLFTLSNRFLLWTDAVLYLSPRDWLTGVGLYNYFPKNENPHSSYVSLLLYFGSPGLLCFFGFIITALAPFREKYKQLNLPTQDRVLYAIVGGMLVCGLYEDNLSYAYYFPQILFWLFFGWVAGKGDGRIPAEKKEKPSLRLVKRAA